MFPPPQSKVAPVVVEDAVRFSVRLTQLKTPGIVMLAFGAAMF